MKQYPVDKLTEVQRSGYMSLNMASFHPAVQMMIIAFIVSVPLLTVESGETLSPQQYWNRVLPNTPMPKTIKDSLYRPEWLEDKSTSVSVGHGGVGVHTGKPGGHHTSVGVGHGGVGAQTGGSYLGGRGTSVGVGKGGVSVQTGKKQPPVTVGVGHGQDPFNYNYAATEAQLHDDPSVALFFLQKDLHAASKMTLLFTRSNAREGATTAPFLRRKEAASIPFSSEKFAEILERFSLSPESEEAKIMKQSINECEGKGIAGEEKYCPTSLESMVDFTTAKLGRNVKAVATEETTTAGGLGSQKKQVYTIMAAKKVTPAGSGEEMVACHKQQYPYAVFYCHKTKKTVAYKVSMVGEDGAKVEAAAVCHKDTAAWNPNHLAFKVLKVKPGTVPICHFLPEDHILWVPN